MALAASTGNDSERSIGYLKQAIELDQRMAEAHYLLGAEYAGAGQYDLAVSEMSAALVHKPELGAARFQLGLLFLTLGRVEEAVTTWGLLDMLPAKHPLHLFKTGMIHLIRDEFEQAVALLREGIAGNSENPPLNRDMQLVIEKIARAQAEASGATDARHVLVSSYSRH